ncbi:type II secretion system protein GspC [Pseudidiomarina sp.]|uniref:type II secretion system protein GspC n=1 Tax=Pseudidiomarina sp. TaxID=2081707 RepID=UPI00299F33AC|nr:type II secretion system protein GspC [Pseudidiomarina sp.]MDX1706528.1 type II secretion system protein GspC [Pseudidiomarina sp.]
MNQLINRLRPPTLWRYGLWTLTAIAALLATWLLARLTWQLLTPVAEPVSGPLAPARQASNPQINVSTIAGLKLFGDAAAPTQQRIASAPKTSLNVRLLGVSASNYPQHSAAIIERSGQQEVYAIGDQLSGSQVTVEEIYADRVILNNQGRLETLELEGIGELGPGLSLTLERGADTGRPVSAPSSVVEEVAENPASILEYVSISPARDGAKIVGYRLRPGPTPELFNQAGFVSGDLAVAINGQDLTDIRTAMSMTRDLASMDSIIVTVNRDGQYIDLELTVPDEARGN